MTTEDVTARVARVEIEQARMARVETRLDTVTRDFGKLESTVDRIETAVQSIQLTLVQMKPARNWPSAVAYLGMLLPMYALVADLIVRGFR